MTSNSHAEATLELLREAEEEGIEGASERVEELESRLEDAQPGDPVLVADGGRPEQVYVAKCRQQCDWRSTFEREPRALNAASRHHDLRGHTTTVDTEVIATDGGHGNYYDVDGERGPTATSDDQDADDVDEEVARLASVEEHEDGGYLITDGAGATAEASNLIGSEKALLVTMFETGGGVVREVRERFVERTEYAETTTTGSLSKLRRKGLVEKRANPLEPNANRWRLTPAGRRVVETQLLATPTGVLDGGPDDLEAAEGEVDDGDD